MEFSSKIKGKKEYQAEKRAKEAKNCSKKDSNERSKKIRVRRFGRLPPLL